MEIIQKFSWRRTIYLFVIAAHSSNLSFLSLVVQLFFGFVLKCSNVFHCKAMPFIDPTENLSKMDNNNIIIISSISILNKCISIDGQLSN